MHFQDGAVRENQQTSWGTIFYGWRSRSCYPHLLCWQCSLCLSSVGWLWRPFSVRVPFQVRCKHLECSANDLAKVNSLRSAEGFLYKTLLRLLWTLTRIWLVLLLTLRRKVLRFSRLTRRLLQLERCQLWQWTSLSLLLVTLGNFTGLGTVVWSSRSLPAGGGADSAALSLVFLRRWSTPQSSVLQHLGAVVSLWLLPNKVDKLTFALDEVIGYLSPQTYEVNHTDEGLHFLLTLNNLSLWVKLRRVTLYRHDAYVRRYDPVAYLLHALTSTFVKNEPVKVTPGSVSETKVLWEWCLDNSRESWKGTYRESLLAKARYFWATITPMSWNRR